MPLFGKKPHLSKEQQDALKTLIPSLMITNTQTLANILEGILLQHFNNIFTKNMQGQTTFVAGLSDEEKKTICAALGLNENTPTIIIDPQKFNADKLRALYSSKDNTNPLWLVLLCAKPIDPKSKYTPKDKIQALSDLAHACKDKKLGDTEKYKSAYQLAQDALSIAKESGDLECVIRLRKQFGPKSELGKWIKGKYQKSYSNEVFQVEKNFEEIEFLETQLFTKQNQATRNQRLEQITGWKNRHTQNIDQKSDLYIVNNAISETLQTDEIFIASMKQMQNILKVYQQIETFNEQETKIINEYESHLKKIIEIYEKFHENLPNLETAKPEELIEALNKRYQSIEFIKFAEQLGKLIDMQAQIDHILSNEKFEKVKMHPAYIDASNINKNTDPTKFAQEINTFSIMPVQRPPRIQLLCKDLHKHSSAFNAYETVSLLVQKINSTKAGQDDALKLFAEIQTKTNTPKEIQQETLKYFLSPIFFLNISTKQLPSYIEAHLNTLLKKAYNDIFDEEGTKIAIRADAGDLERINMISAALGADLSKLSKPSPSQEDIENALPGTNPANFNAEKLQILYKLEDNLLWLVLLSTKPVDEKFSAQKKVEIYVQLADAYKDGTLGKHGKHAGVFEITQAAYALALEHPECLPVVEKAFGAESKFYEFITKADHNKENKGRVEEFFRIQPEIHLLNGQLKEAQKQVSTLKINLDQTDKAKSIAEQKVNELGEKIKQLESQLTATKSLLEQTQKELQTTKESQKKVENGLSKIREENNTLKTEVANYKKVVEENPRLKQQNPLPVSSQETLHNSAELAQIKAEKTELISQINNMKERSDLAQQKLQLGISLGKISGVLSTKDSTQIENEITLSENEQDLSKIQKKIRYLTNVNQVITGINTGILKRAGFFSSPPVKKVEAINQALKNLSIDEKLELASLSSDQIKSKISTKDQSNIGKFLQEIHHKRGFIPIGEATSFKEFKKTASILRNEITDEDLKNLKQQPTK